MEYKTEQESFWAQSFGNEYTMRSGSEKKIAAKTAMFADILRRTEGVQSCLELGANKGTNLIALKRLIPGVRLEAVEINKQAAETCEKIEGVKVFCGSIFDYPIRENAFDLVFTRGVLIHINPDKLKDVYHTLYQCSSKYIMVAEYYNPTPVEVDYRGYQGKLFKRDFAGEIMDLYPDVELIDYKFVYERDPNFPGDDITWFLLRKKTK